MKNQSFCIISLFLLLLCVLPVTAQQLEAEKLVSQKIGGGETQTFNLPLTANQFFSLTVKQYATDVAVKLIAPDEKVVAETDLQLGGSVIERLWFIAPTAGTYKLQIISAEKQAKSEITKLKPNCVRRTKKRTKI